MGMDLSTHARPGPPVSPRCSLEVRFQPPTTVFIQRPGTDDNRAAPAGEHLPLGDSGDSLQWLDGPEDLLACPNRPCRLRWGLSAPERLQRAHPIVPLVEDVCALLRAAPPGPGPAHMVAQVCFREDACEGAQVHVAPAHRAAWRPAGSVRLAVRPDVHLGALGRSTLFLFTTDGVGLPEGVDGAWLLQRLAGLCRWHV